MGGENSCYDLIAGRVPDEAWHAYADTLSQGFTPIPEDWPLDASVRARLKLRIQYEFFNPDLCDYLPEKVGKVWAFLHSFLPESLRRKYHFLRSRHEDEALEQWDRGFSEFENLLLLTTLTESGGLEWLTAFDGRMRHGDGAQRIKVIKNKGLNLSSDLLGVGPLMDWGEIKARFRFMIKKHHPDLGGDPAVTKKVIAEFERLTRERDERAAKRAARRSR